MTNFNCCCKYNNKKIQNQIFIVKYYKKHLMQQLCYDLCSPSSEIFHKSV